MDPNACLAEMRELTAEINEGLASRMDRAERLAELIDGLDGWIMSGGFLPQDWQHRQQTDWAQFAADMRDGSPEALARHLPPEIAQGLRTALREQQLRPTRVVPDVGSPGKWVAQYHDPEKQLWFDIGDPRATKAEAEAHLAETELDARMREQMTHDPEEGGPKDPAIGEHPRFTEMDARRNAAIRSVPCRFKTGTGVPCGAQPGQPCTDHKGRPVTWHHSSRVMDQVRS